MSGKKAMELWDDEEGFVITADGRVVTDDSEIAAIQVLDEATEEEYEIAQQAAERLLRLGRSITPVRVFAASAILLLLLSSIFATWYWVIPRDAVEVETVYFQRGGGHVILVQVDNLGSRTIRDISLTLIFEDSEGFNIAETSWHKGELPSHSSYSGDDLELLVQGYTVWDEYTIVISLSWQDDSGRKHSETFSHQVGEWTSEHFYDEAGKNWILF
ncbi:MAG: hypothetical protein ACKVHH_04980 [Candidatus Poseidoniales archaeon]|jgi:hypothetical protein|tara:strand:+ start:266 stop:913 length:648 start_codon:yes stop_codon:yes gene_type:complete